MSQNFDGVVPNIVRGVTVDLQPYACPENRKVGGDPLRRTSSCRYTVAVS